MKLEDFISEALIEIVSGIKRAQTSTESTGAKINPKGYIVPQGKLVGQKWNSKNGDTTEVIENDTIEIRGRGNSTWNFPKKPYRIKFAKIDRVFF